MSSSAAAPTAPAAKPTAPQHGDCAICSIASFPSASHRASHLAGEKHRKKAAAAIANPQPQSQPQSSPAPVAASPPPNVVLAVPPRTRAQGDSSTVLLSASSPSPPPAVASPAGPRDLTHGRCEDCNLDFFSASDRDQHMQGKKHLKKISPLTNGAAIASPKPPPPSPETVEAISNAQGAMTRLTAPLRDWIKQQPTFSQPKRKNQRAALFDLADCLHVLRAGSNKEMRRLAERALSLRNQVAHQDANLNDCRRGMPYLVQLAAAIGAKDVEHAIAKLMPPTISEADLLTRSAEALTEAQRQVAADRHTEAMNALTQVLSSVPTDAATRTTTVLRRLAALYARRARVELKLNRLDLAREDAEDAVQADPKDLDHRVLLVEVLLELKLVAEAGVTCTDGLEINPHHQRLLLLQRDCGAGVVKQRTDQNTSKPEEALTEKILSQYGEALKREHATRTPSPRDVHIISMDEQFQKELLRIRLIVECALDLLNGIGVKRDLVAARREFTKAAELGNAEGLFNLGMCFLEGVGGERNERRAIECWRAAVKQKPWIQLELSAQARTELTRQGIPNLMCNIGVREAENALGICYRNGHAVDIDLAVAVEWYLKAAEHGNAEGMNTLGYFLCHGVQLPKNERSARHWLKCAAESREPPAEAMMNYADLCREGRGGPRDVDEALKYYRMAAKLGQPNAAEQVQRIERSNANTASGPTLSPILDPNMADTWWLRGRNCELGEGGSIVDLEQAVEHYRKAIELKHLLAPYQLAQLLSDQLRRPTEAFPIMLQAAKAGHPLAQFQLAHMYVFGHGCSRDEFAATRWQKRAERHAEAGWAVFQRAKPKYRAPPLDFKHGREVCEWEAEQQPPLGCDGTTVPQRIQRHALDKMSSMPGVPPQVVSGLTEVLNMMNQPPAELSRKPIHADVTQWMPLVEQRAAAGSKTAKAVLQSHAMIAQATQLVINHALAAGATDLVQAVETLDARTVNSILGTLRQAFRLWDLHVWVGDQLDIFRSVADRALGVNPNHADSLFFSCRNFQCSAAEKITLLKRFVSLHPNDADMLHLLACCRGFGPQPDLTAQLVDMERAIELDGMMVDWRFTLGSSLRQQTTNTTEHSQRALVEYQRYLDGSQADAGKVPEAHYSMGLIHLLRDRSELARQQYHKGLAAEAHRLPCLTPVGDFPPRRKLAVVFGLDSAFSSSSVSSPQQPPCATCNYAGTLKRQRCTVCKVVFYCDRECQKRHYKVHRSECKPPANSDGTAPYIKQQNETPVKISDVHSDLLLQLR